MMKLLSTSFPLPESTRTRAALRAGQVDEGELAHDGPLGVGDAVQRKDHDGVGPGRLVVGPRAPRGPLPAEWPTSCSSVSRSKTSTSLRPTTWTTCARWRCERSARIHLATASPNISQRQKLPHTKSTHTQLAPARCRASSRTSSLLRSFKRSKSLPP